VEQQRSVLRSRSGIKRLHADGAISAGIIVTRGKSLHENMDKLVKRFVEERFIFNYEDIRKWGYEPTSKQRRAIDKRVNRKKNPLTFQDAFVSKFVADKFGEATTHWRKLEDRVRRGVGNPCPLVLVGLPDNIVTFDEGPAALEEVMKDEERADADPLRASRPHVGFGSISSFRPGWTMSGLHLEAALIATSAKSAWANSDQKALQPA
jgi:hypothetical protein